METMKKLTLLLILMLLKSASANDLSLLSSSLFEMELIPTSMPLQSSAANKLQIFIKTSLFQTTSVTSGFEDVFEIHVVLQKMVWMQETESTTVQFQAHITFFSDDGGESEISEPSQFSLDSLIVRTFSQPSTKSGFIFQLGLSQDPGLELINDVSTHIVLASTDEVDIPPSIPDNRQFSTLDAVLITTSAAIFLGILCVVYTQHRARERYDEDFLHSETRIVQSSASNIVHLDDGGDQNSAKMEPTSNVDITASTDSDGQMTQEEMSPHEIETIIRESDAHNILKTRKDTFSSQRSVDNDEDIDSPPLSPSPSVQSSSSGESPTTRSSSVVPLSPVQSAHTTSYLLEVLSPIGNFTSSPVQSPLTARLLRLPSISTSKHPRHRGASRSYFSAPANLIEKSRSSAMSTVSRDGARSVRSVRSIRSAWSSSSLFEVTEHPGLETASTRSSALTDLAVISDQNLLLTASEDFDRNWEVSKKLAKDDDDDGSTMDVFHVEVDQHSSVGDNQSRMSGHSAVSDWMKSIRVVCGSADSRTSEMSKSSAENSSIEPRFMQQRDNISVDRSLERSLATSIVEV